LPRIPFVRLAARVGAIVSAAVLGLVALADGSDVNTRLAGLDGSVTGSIGSGLVVVAIAAVLAFAGALLGSNRATKRS